MHKKCSIQELRRFGLFVGSLLLAVGIYRWLKYTHSYGAFLAIGGIFIVAGVVFPQSLRLPYRGWFWAGEFLGNIVSKVVLSIFFFLVFTPLALMRRLFVKDPLKLKIDRTAVTYFHPKKIQQGKQMDRMF